MQEAKRKFIKIFMVGIVLAGCIAGWLWVSIQQYSSNAIICKADFFVFISDPQLFFQTFFLLPIFLIVLSQMLRNMGRVQIIIREGSRGSIWQRHVWKTIRLAAGFTLCLVVFTGFFSLIAKVPTFNWREEHSVYWAWCGRQVLKANWVHLANVVIAFAITEFLLLCTLGILFTFIHFLTSRFWAGWLCLEGLMIYRENMLHAGQRGGFIQKMTIDWALWEDIRLWYSGIITGIFIIFIIGGMGYVYVKRKGFLNEK